MSSWEQARKQKTKELIKDMTFQEILNIRRFAAWNMVVLSEKQFKFHLHAAPIDEKLAEFAIDNILLGKDPSDIE